MDRLSGKVAIVTGAASGIGEASARLFVREGARVVIGDIREAEGRAVAESLGADCVFVKTEVSLSEDVGRLVNSAVDEFGKLDVLFNNAGIMGGEGTITHCSEERWDRIIKTDLKGPWLGMKHALPHMIRNGAGSIITTSSHSGDMGMIGRGAYGSAKAGVQALTRMCAIENARHFVRANCVVPGAILTHMALGGGLERPERPVDREAVAAELARMHAIPRVGMPDDIAHAALWLASDDSSFVTGHTLVVDGGWGASARLPVERMESGVMASSAEF